MVRLSNAQASQQAARLAKVHPILRAAFAKALLAWQLQPELAKLGRPIVTTGYRSSAEQEVLYAQGRTQPGKVVTYKRGGESRHNSVPAQAVDVAFLLRDGQVSWSAKLLGRFAQLMKAASSKVRWGGDWKSFKDRPHFEV
ncbi:M15 family metallopeptidase [Hymenobacter sp. BT18]|uniref:M15 family metallopeptidase n=1 Tax=Hymenobacter sp. BT18 TaxID=2835648 RepID=UPI00143ED0DC|nr:M15 family metallopeptidase [Hymenobacter sp. BT18]QIX62744.1 M15 family metallopeptidase [Hymenobacter sp. BT18]